MTRIEVTLVQCPACEHIQETRIVTSWNEYLSGPLPPDAFVTRCDACDHEFDPDEARLPEPPPRERTRSWWRPWR